ncbi:hypothetical protein PG993_008757 [Apiospora rasikravindrae]|uniref:Uncharacterized protein n=1 Tax=Apiospora rasikravindrae TaxID=990691 RepID=A0ABR1SP98_9PEZI
MTSRTGIFTSAVSVESSVVTTTDINGFASTITTRSVAAAILSWLPDGNYTYLTYTYLPFRTETTENSAPTATETTLERTATPSPAPSTSSGLGSGAIAGIVVGAVVGAAMLAVLGWLLFHYRRKALKRPSSPRQSQEITSHHGPADSPEPERELDQQQQYRKEDRYELGEPDHIPQHRQEQYQKPELDASTSEVLRY